MASTTTPALGWGDYIAGLVEEHGSLAAVASKLSLAEGVDANTASIERALRRLRTKTHDSGGQYGRWLLRAFGLPSDVQRRAKWMGVYHSRFTDLPVQLCLDQLRLWDRPPLAESRTREWLALGFATCALRQNDLEAAERHLAGARGGHGSAAARLEVELTEAYLAARRHARTKVAAMLDGFEAHLRAADLEGDERACLFARWIDQCAYQRLHPEPGANPDVEGAKRLYERIPSDDAPFFAACKKQSGLAYVSLLEGETVTAAGHAELACRHAGDGGFVRLRIQALGLLAHILGPSRGRDAVARAMRAARDLEDDDLLARLQRRHSSSDWTD